LVAAEEPLEIRIEETPLAVVMRTPGDDDELATGFLLTEGVLLAPSEIEGIDHHTDSRVSVRLCDGVSVDPTQFQRNMFVSSSCGVCGKASIESVQLFARPAKKTSLTSSRLMTLTERLRTQQPTFDATGGLHAAGLLDLATETMVVREDIGRHNAVDKAIGATARRQWPLPPSVLVVSGRQSFEIVQKAAMAGIGAVVGVSAPSSLAVELASSLGMLLAGFSRDNTFNVYAGEEHLVD
jgi:FdhD protein